VRGVDGESELSERRPKDGAQLAPDGVAYERLTVLLLNLVKRQRTAIDALTAKINEWEAYGQECSRKLPSAS